MNGISISIYIKKDLYEFLKKEAEREKRSISNMVCLILDRYAQKKREGDLKCISVQ
jgi:predicted CopG family antitoxin